MPQNKTGPQPVKDWSEKLQRTFGVNRCPDALLYEFEFAMRFELSGEQFGMNQPIRRFLQAYQRANAIAEKSFRNSTDLYAFIRGWGDKDGPILDCSRLNFVFPNVRRSDFTELSQTDTDEDEREFWYVAPITDSLQIMELLWLDIAHEMPVEPASYGHSTWLVDFENEIILRAYDDRGLDIISTTRKTLQPLYNKFADWLLEYDREKVDAAFKTP